MSANRHNLTKIIMNIYYIATVIKNELVENFKLSSNIELIEFLPLYAQETEDEIAQELKKLGMTLIGLERLDLLESKLKIINDFKDDINKI